MMITDQISSFVPSPLIGPNSEELGPRFPDMSCVYDAGFRTRLKEKAQENGIHLEEGVYMMFSGPNYETPAEVRMAGTLGADAVGMSTVPEAIVCGHCGIPVLGIPALPIREQAFWISH